MSLSFMFQFSLDPSGTVGPHGAHVEVIAWDPDPDLVLEVAVQDWAGTPTPAQEEAALSMVEMIFL